MLHYHTATKYFYLKKLIELWAFHITVCIPSCFTDTKGNYQITRLQYYKTPFSVRRVCHIDWSWPLMEHSLCDENEKYSSKSRFGCKLKSFLHVKMIREYHNIANHYNAVFVKNCQRFLQIVAVNGQPITIFPSLCHWEQISKTC